MNQKMRSLVTLLALAVIGGGIGLYAWFGVHVAQEEEQKAKQQAAKLFDFDKSKVKRIVVTAKGQTTTVVPGEGQRWNVVSPVTAAADKPTVDALVERMAQLSSKSVVEEKAQDLAKYGLDSPKLRVTLQLEDGKELVFRAGEENQFDNSVYVLAGDSGDVILAEGNFKWALEKDTFDLREKRVVPFDDPDVAAMQVTAGARRYSLKKGDDGWQLASGDRADETTVNRLLSTLRNLRANRFDTDTIGPGDAARYGFDQPAGEVVLTSNDGVRVTVTFGQTEEDGVTRHWARRADATFVAEINSLALDDLKVSDFDLRDKSVLRFENDQVHALRMTVGGETFTVQRTKTGDDPGDAWSFEGGGATKKWKVNSLLTTLRNLKAAAFTEQHARDLAKYGLDAPTKTVTLLGEGGQEIGTLLVGQESDDKVYVKTAASNRVMEVEKSRLSELPSKREDLADETTAAE